MNMAKGDELRLTDVPSIKNYMTAAKDMIQKIKTDKAPEMDAELKEKLLNAKEYKLNLSNFSIRPLIDEQVIADHSSRVSFKNMQSHWHERGI